jgi:homoserine kinase
MVDVIIEPVRAILIPEFNEVKQAAIEAGALGCSISGAGPSMFALSKSEAEAQRIGEAMKQAFLNAEIASLSHVSSINYEGPKILASR